MKIRGDFVTNSSSVSFILTMKEDIIDQQIDFHKHVKSGLSEYLKFVKDKIKNEGHKTVLEGKDIYSLTLTFDTGNAIPLVGFNDNEYFCFDACHDINISSLTDDELNQFLYWTILYPQYLSGIGLTKIFTATGF
jgi:hypothetical protein